MLKTTSINHEPLEIADDLGSDHLPVLLKIDVNLRLFKLNTFYDHSNTNWDVYRTNIDQNLNLNVFQTCNLTSKENIDIAIDDLENIIKNALNESVPLRVRREQPNLLTDEIKSLIRIRRSQIRLYQRNGFRHHKQAANFIQSRIKSLCDIAYNDNFQDHISSFIPNEHYNKKLWKITKILKNKRPNIPPLHIDNQHIITDQEKAEIISDKFLDNHMLTVNQSISNALSVPISLIERELSQALINNDPSTLTNVQEIRNIITKLKNNKAPGVDGVTNKALKQGGRKLTVALMYIFNACLIQNYFPNRWKNAVTVPVPKPNKPLTNPSSYRPISLLSCIGKLFERLILSRIQNFLEIHDILPNYQFGFRRGHSTTHQINRVCKTIRDGFQNKQSTGMVLFDISCAFDSVWHNGLLYKMQQLNFPRYLLHLIHSFLSNRTFRVKINSKLSSSKSIPAGVPQGAVLSPSLFNIYLHDLPTISDGYNYQFADDIAATKTDKKANSIKKSLQDYTLTITRYFRHWKLQLNPTKSEAIFFTRRRHDRAFPRNMIKVSNFEVEWKDCVKYLGVYLDQKLIFKNHIETVMTKVGKCVRALYSLISRNSRLFPSNKLLLYKAMILPILLYASPSWSNCAYTHIHKLQVLQNKILKMCLNLHHRYSTDNLHYIANMKKIPHQLNEAYTRFANNCNSSDDPLIFGLVR